MKKLLVAAVLLGFAVGAQAQTYRWKDRSGNVHFGDIPPPGVHATPLDLPATGPSQSGEGAPHELTPEQEQQRFRKEQLEHAKAEKKAARERERERARKENCASARESLRTLASGQRIVTIGANGERHYLSDTERARRETRARAAVKQWCD